MSFADVCSSIVWIVATAASPKGTPGVVGAIGTDATCKAQGFFYQLGFAAPLYNCMICIYSMLVISYNRTEEQIEKTAEPFMHIVAIGYPLGAAITGLALDLYHSNGDKCFIHPDPSNCKINDSSMYQCSEEDDTHFYQRLFTVSIILVSIIVIILTMTRIYCTIRNRTRMMVSRYGERTIDNSKTNLVFTQAILYIGAFFLTYFWSMLAVMLRAKTNKNTPFALLVMTRTFNPLQGFWNFITLIRPGFNRIRRMHPQKSRFAVLRDTIVAETSKRALRVSRASRRSFIDTTGNNGSSVFKYVSNSIRGFGKDSGRGENRSGSLFRDGSTKSIRDYFRGDKAENRSNPSLSQHRSIQRIDNDDDNNGVETGALSDKNQSEDIGVTRSSKVASIRSEEIVFSRASHMSNDEDNSTRPPLFPENGSLTEETTSEELRDNAPERF
jgi:hypothetical protein